MPGRTRRLMGMGMVATACAGVLGLSAMVNPTSAHADNIGLVIGGTGDPNPGPGYVQAADLLYVDQKYAGDITSFYQATQASPFGPGFPTPEQAYPLFGGGVQQLYFNLSDPSTDLPANNTSVGLGSEFLNNAILSDISNSAGSTVFGYSQSSTLSGITMQLLEHAGITSSSPDAPQFLLIADPNNPNGGLFERFNGFETTSGHTTVDPLNLSSLGISFDGATPANDFTTNVYTLEYDGFADFPRYPLNFLSDLNAFLGIAELHGTYLNYALNGTGPSPTDIADAVHLTTVGESLTNYYMIDTLDGAPVTAPLVGLLPAPLQELLGPDLTYLINLGYGDGTLGYSDTAANVPTPFGLFPDVSLSTVLSTLGADTEQGFANLMSGADPYAGAEPATSVSDLLSALEADAANPAASLTDIVNAISSASSALYSTLLPTTDIINTLITSLPAYGASLFADNLATGDLADAIGLPLAVNTAIGTLAAGFEGEILSTAISQATADLSGLF